MTCALRWHGRPRMNSPGNAVRRFSIGEDNVMYRWNVSTAQATKFMDLENSGMDIDWAPMAKGTSELFAIGFADGSFKLINRNGRVDKTVAEAHKGCITSLKWSYDGGALATAG
jgi:intraflagellar transport protein 80